MTTKETYKGFEIDSQHRIYRNGKQIFCAHWQQNYSNEQAKETIDHSLRMKEQQTNYQQHQENKYGDVLPEIEINPDGSCENGMEELQRFENWIHEQAEQQLYEHERGY